MGVHGVTFVPVLLGSDWISRASAPTVARPRIVLWLDSWESCLKALLRGPGPRGPTSDPGLEPMCLQVTLVSARLLRLHSGACGHGGTGGREQQGGLWGSQAALACPRWLPLPLDLGMTWLVFAASLWPYLLTARGYGWGQGSQESRALSLVVGGGSDFVVRGVSHLGSRSYSPNSDTESLSVGYTPSKSLHPVRHRWGGGQLRHSVVKWKAAGLEQLWIRLSLTLRRTLVQSICSGLCCHCDTGSDCTCPLVSWV